LIYIPEILVNQLSQFLEGKAYQFYMTNASSSRPIMNLQDFYKALMNHCFPPNFMQRERECYEMFAQRDLDVQTYLNELEFQHTIVGGGDEQDVVHRAWNGCWPEYQAELWKQRLNPEFSSLDEFREELVLLEKAAQVSRRTESAKKKEEKVASTSRNTTNHRSPHDNAQSYSGRDANASDKLVSSQPPPRT
jgi:hypothetical protein